LRYADGLIGAPRLRRGKVNLVRQQEKGNAGMSSTAAVCLPWPDQLDRSRCFIPEHLTPLSYTPIYRELDPHHRLRYNQLQAMCFNEQIIFFETEIGTGVMKALLRETWPAGFAGKLRQFWEDEVRHSAMFRDLNQAGAPQLYGAGDFHFIRIARPAMALLRWTTGNPRLFPMFIWMVLLQEERSLYYSSEYLRHADDVEPRFVATNRAHMIDEAGHVRCDLELLDQLWPQIGPQLRRINARLLGWMVREFVSGPKRGQLQVIHALLAEFPELRGHEARIKQQLLALDDDPEYQLTLYSRKIAPRSFGRFDKWPEFHVLESAMPGYRRTAVRAA
jgi:hypothetical protein